MTGSFCTADQLSDLVERAPIRGAVAEEMNHDITLAAAFQGHPHTGCDHEPAAERTALAEDAVRGVDDVHHAAFAVVRAADAVGDVREDCLHRRSAGEHVSHPAMAVEHLVARAERGQRRALFDLLTSARMERRGYFAGQGELRDALLEAAGSQGLSERSHENVSIHGLPPLISINVLPRRPPSVTSRRGIKPSHVQLVKRRRSTPTPRRSVIITRVL